MAHRNDPGTLFTDDVVGWSPYVTRLRIDKTSPSSRPSVRHVLERRHPVPGLDEVGNKAYAEWVIEADHTGPFVLDEDVVLDATGRHVKLAGVTVADFRDGKIRSFRTYFDDISLIAQMVSA